MSSPRRGSWRWIALGILVSTGPTSTGLAAEDAASFDCAEVGHLWENASREELRDAKLHLRSTKLYFSQQLFTKAAREAELAIHLDATQPEYHMRLGMAYAELKCYDAAGRAFGEAQRLGGTAGNEALLLDIKNNRQHYWDARFLEASDHFGRQEYEAAATEFRNAIAIDSTDVRAWRNLGMAGRATDDNSAALAALQKAYTLDPNDEQTRGLLRSQLALAARKAYRNAQMTASKDSTRAQGLAELTSAVGLFDQAISLAAPDEEVSEYAANAAITLHTRAKFEQLADPQAARPTFIEAIAWHRKSEEARKRAVAAGKVNPDVSDFAATLEHLKFVLSCFAQVEEFDSTLTYATRVIDEDPRWRDGYQYVASAYRHQGGKPDEALRYLIMWQCLDPKVKPAPDVTQHMAQLLTVYKPADAIVKFSMTAAEPEEIRVYKEGDQVYEAWIDWSKGSARTFLNGRDLGTISFKPVSAAPPPDAAPEQPGK